MIRKLSFIIVALGLSLTSLKAEQISSMKELTSEWQKADEKTLVVFDVDDVLITAEDHCLHPYADEVFYKHIYERISKATTREEKLELENKFSLYFLLPKRLVIEESTPSLIQSLQQRPVKVIALTSCRTGKLGVIPKIERWRIDHLKSVGFDFSSAFPEIKRLPLDEIAKEGIPAPLFEEGILFSEGYTKGEVLKEFFKQTGFYPTKVIFVDDLIANLTSVAGEMQTLGIECQTVHYIGAKPFSKPVNEQVLVYQMNHLIQTQEWLSDEQVMQRLYPEKEALSQ